MDILQELGLFLTLVDSGSFTEASRRLGIPRATLSRRLSRYEEALGVHLFERSTRALRLTEPGRLLRDRGTPLMVQAQRLEEEVSQVDEVPRGHLVVAFQTGLGRDFAAGFVQRLQQECPLVELRLISSPHPLEEALELADVILTEGPLGDLDWVSVNLWTSDRVAVAAPSYLEERGAPLQVEDLKEHTLLAISHDPRQAITWPLMSGGALSVTPAVTSDDLDTLVQCAVEGLGIALLPLTVAAIPLAKGSLVAVLPEVLGREAQFYVLYPRHRRASPKIRIFLQSLNGYILDMTEAIAESYGVST